MKPLVLIALLACGTSSAPSGLVNTPAIDDFRSVEKTTLHTFSAALAQQRANAIDELGLADAIDRTVLPPWRDLRSRISAANAPEADRGLFTTLERYVAERQTSWEAYSAALRSHDDAEAKPHYAKYREQNAAADSDAKQLGLAFRSLN